MRNLTRNPRTWIWTSFALAVVLALAAGCNSQQVNWSPDPPWAAAPLSFEWTGIDPKFDSSMQTALDGWNHVAGCTVAVRASDPATADVSMAPYDGTICSSSVPTDLDTVPGAVAGYARCSADHGEIRFKVLSDLDEAFVEAEHEEGHAFGLAHDDSALMQPRPPLPDQAAFGGSRPQLLLLPSDEDGAAVASRFCR